MITVKNLNKQFGQQQVLHNINIAYLPGECSLVIGASGSGKTVLIKSLVGLHEVDSGEIWYNDIQFNALNFKEKKRFEKRLECYFKEVLFLILLL